MLFYTKNNYIFNHSEATRTSIKYQFMPLNWKFSQLLNGITCNFVPIKKTFYRPNYNERNVFFFREICY